MRLIRAVCILATCVIPAIASTPQFSPRQDINTKFQHLTGVAVADFNGDGKPDIAVTDNFTKVMAVYLNNGSGGFSTSVSTTIQMTAIGAGPLVAGDFDEDGKQDIVVGTTAGLQEDIFLKGNGDGTFTQGQTLPGSYGFLSAVAADINHDSHLDLLIGGNGSLYVYLGDGHGNFTAQPFTSQGSSDAFFDVVAADFNNDNKTDFVTTAYIQNNLRSYLGAGDGTFGTPLTIGPVPLTIGPILFSHPQSLASADFNGDGKADLLVGSANIGEVVFGNGDGTFNTSRTAILSIPNVPGNLSISPPVVAAADMDGDGKVDAVAADNLSNTLNIFLNDGTGTFPRSGSMFSTSIPNGSGALRLADLNGDGLLDVIVTNYVTQNLYVFLSIRPQTTPTVTLSSNASQQLVGAPLSLTVRIPGQTGLVTTGAVTLLEGSTTLGQQTLDANGQATFSVPSLATGQHTFFVNYGGDKNYLPTTSNNLVEAITDFQVALPNSSQTVSRGGTATYSLTLTPVAAFVGTVTLTCSGLPVGTSCSSTTSALNGQPGTVSLNVITSTASLQYPDNNRQQVIKNLVVSFASILFVVFFPGKRRPYLRLLAVLLTFVGTSFVVGCSRPSSANNSPPATPVTTSFTITASTTQGSQTVTHQTSASITVN